MGGPADNALSSRARVRVLIGAGILLALLIGIACVRLVRLVHELDGLDSYGYRRVRNVIVERLGVEKGRLSQKTTVGELIRLGVRRGDLISILEDEFGKQLRDEDLQADRTLASLGDQLEG